MSRDEAVRICEGQLFIYDMASRGNDIGSNIWRDLAAAIRVLIAEPVCGRCGGGLDARP